MKEEDFTSCQLVSVHIVVLCGVCSKTDVASVAKDACLTLL